MTWNRRNIAQQRVRKKADHDDRHNIYMFNKFCTLGTDFTLSDFRLRFRLRKTRFTDLLKILDKVLSTLYRERSATYNVATSFIAEILYNICQGWTLEQVIGHLFGVSVFSACTEPFIRFQWLSRNEKNIHCHSLRTCKIYQEKVSFFGGRGGGVRKLLYPWLPLFSVLFHVICFFNFLRIITSRSLKAFPPLDFLA